MTTDITGKLTTILFDLVEGSSPLTIGLEVKKYTDDIKRASQ